MRKKEVTTPEAAIRQAIARVCSDGNSDAKRVACDVVRALELAGFEIVAMTPRRETIHLTRSHQRVMHRAVRRTFKMIDSTI